MRCSDASPDATETGPDATANGLSPSPSSETTAGESPSETRPPTIEDDLGDPDDSFRQAKESAVARWERRYIASLLTRSGGNISGAARTARMDRNHLRELIRKHGLDPRSSRPAKNRAASKSPENPGDV